MLRPSPTGTLRFEIASETARVELALELFEEDEICNTDSPFAMIDAFRFAVGAARSRRQITAFFYEAPPMMWFVDGSSLEGNEHVELRREPAPYDANKIDVWDWTGTDLTKESQGAGKEAASIQTRVIRELAARNLRGRNGRRRQGRSR